MGTDTFCYMGGKSYRAPEIISLMPPHQTYCEPFFGSGAVFFIKPKAQVNILNDKNEEISNLLFKICFNAKEIKETIEILPSSEVIFKYMQDPRPVIFDELTLCQKKPDLCRAIKTLYLICNSFNAQKESFAFSVSKKRNCWEVMSGTVMKMQKKLRECQILCKDYKDVMLSCDSPGTLFYLDPPYSEALEKNYYQINFSLDDHLQLAELLKSIKGRFILSYSDSPSIRELYKDFQIIVAKPHALRSQAKIGKNKGKKSDYTRELLILNYKPLRQGELWS